MKINEMKKVSKSAKLLFSQMSVAKQQIFLSASLSERYITSLSVAESRTKVILKGGFCNLPSFTKNISMILQKRPFGALKVCFVYYCCQNCSCKRRRGIYRWCCSSLPLLVSIWLIFHESFRTIYSILFISW